MLVLPLLLRLLSMVPILGILGLRPWDISGWFYVAMVVGGLVVVTWWFDTVRLKETRKH